MPTPLPSSFASAAAGNTQDPSRRGDGGAGGEWSRTRTNGATQTFRRPSVATNPSHTREGSQPASVSTPTSGAYMPPHLSSNTMSSALRNGEARYSKEQLLDMYRAQRESGSLGKNVEDYFVADWDPHTVTAPANGAWGKRDDHKTSAGPEVCWDHGGQAEPLALTDMSDGEKELFSASVNSPLKPPPTSASKENTAPVTGGRKGSISYTQGHINNYSTSSPNAARPGARRRETGDSIGNPMSPTGSNPRFFRDEANTSTPPPALLRRKTDFRESKPDEKAKEGGPDPSSQFGSLKRSSTNPLNTAVGGPSSPWGSASASQNANFSPMGAFGAFSLGSNAAAQTPTSEKKAGFGSLRGESRFKGLLSKDSSEDIAGSAREKALGNLERLAEDDDHSRSQSPWGDAVKTRAGRSETNPFDEPRSGSAALGGSQDVEAPSQAELGFGAFGMTSSIPGFRELMQSHENSRNPTPSLLQGHEPTSPTNTNPYQSPHGDKTAVDPEDVDTDGSDIQQPQHPGLSGLRDPSNPFGSMKRVGSGIDLPTVDRSQNSSANANRNFSGLGGLGGLSGLGGPSAWSSGGAIGTPTRERSAFGGFGDPIFGSMGGDLQSPSLSTLAGGGFFSPHAGISGTASIGRSSKLGALFSGMQDDQSRPESVAMDDALRQDASQAVLDGSASKPGSNSASQTPVSAVGSLPANLTHDIAQAQTPGGTVPSAQQRTMVMPDRMRWIYRDPQGNIQGPWTGLEMHDWFKAGFFSPDLQIKKLEDIEFEPLAQLVRRIGNSREPFLVPQIGIPHGPEPSGPQWTGAAPAGSAQPPFPGSFPSFGTTLTAEQQNALERRKQEEQYLMARQKEHLAQQQAIMKQMHVPGAPASAQPPLQHQSSAHSLHSQPSFGSIASPGAYQPSPIQAPNQGQQSSQQAPGFFDAAGPIRQGGLSNVTPGMLGTDIGNQDQLAALVDRLNVGRQDPFAFGGASFSSRQSDSLFHSQQVASMLQDRAQLQEEQDQFDKANPDDLFAQQAREERLRQFNALRAQEGDMVRTAEGLPTHPANASQQLEAEAAATSSEMAAEMLASDPETSEPTLTLSQQVQKAASAQRQQQQEQEQAPESVWGKVDRAMPQPFPPPPSASPLPAPAAQRNRQNVADALAAGSRSQTQTPVDAPATSVAPWAKDTHELPKGPSLKEIQEAEARTAAQREEVAAAARRAQLVAEQERLSQAQAHAVPGLPSSANWASAGSPGIPTATTGSAWSTKTQPTPTNTATKKTLAQIQKEEEARKQRLAAAAAAAAQTATPSPPASASKRYADLASKAPAPSPAAGPAVTGAWTTVGAGGKAKAPPAAPLGPRSTSGTIPVAPAAASKPRPVVATRTVTAGSVSQSNPNRAVEEFSKWAKFTLGKGLNSNINVDDFVQQLLFLPAEAEIISDSVYANSQTMDGRRFAEEFIRRRKLADKGVVEPVSPSAMGETKNAGGWSEVAKKGSTASAATPVSREEEAAAAAFKVVAPRKKGKR